MIPRNNEAPCDRQFLRRFIIYEGFIFRNTFKFFFVYPHRERHRHAVPFPISSGLLFCRPPWRPSVLLTGTILTCGLILLLQLLFLVHRPRRCRSRHSNDDVGVNINKSQTSLFPLKVLPAPTSPVSCGPPLLQWVLHPPRKRPSKASRTK